MVKGSHGEFLTPTWLSVHHHYIIIIHSHNSLLYRSASGWLMIWCWVTEVITPFLVKSSHWQAEMILKMLLIF